MEFVACRVHVLNFLEKNFPISGVMYGSDALKIVNTSALFKNVPAPAPLMIPRASRLSIMGADDVLTEAQLLAHMVNLQVLVEAPHLLCEAFYILFMPPQTDFGHSHIFDSLQVIRILPDATERASHKKCHHD